MPDLDLEPGEYREEGRTRPRYSVMDYINYGLPSWWKVNQTDQRDDDFESRQLNAFMFGIGAFLMKKFMGH